MMGLPNNPLISRKKKKNFGTQRRRRPTEREKWREIEKGKEPRESRRKTEGERDGKRERETVALRMLWANQSGFK